MTPQRLGVVSEKPNIYTPIPQHSNTGEEVELVGEMKLDKWKTRGTWNKNHVGTSCWH